MKTAKEMFEELGYEKFENDSRITYEKYNRECKMIEFDKERMEITFADDNYCEVVMIDRKELQAINKQVEELGWLDE